MIKKGTVVHKTAQTIWIELEANQHCQSCQSTLGCSFKWLALPGTKRPLLQVKDTSDYPIGSIVTAEFQSISIWYSLLAYLLPIVGLFLGACLPILFSFDFLAPFVDNKELVQMIFCLVGLVFGIALARLLLGRCYVQNRLIHIRGL